MKYIIFSIAFFSYFSFLEATDLNLEHKKRQATIETYAKKCRNFSYQPGDNGFELSKDMRIKAPFEFYEQNIKPDQNYSLANFYVELRLAAASSIIQEIQIEALPFKCMQMGILCSVAPITKMQIIMGLQRANIAIKINCLRMIDELNFAKERYKEILTHQDIAIMEEGLIKFLSMQEEIK